MLINQTRVTEIFRDCLYTEEETKGVVELKDMIMVEGITFNVGFNPIRIEKNKKEIEELINNLAPGWENGKSFLNLCVDSEGELWTGLHIRMEELLLLGMAINKFKYCCEKEYWSVLPGGMPYIALVR